MEVRLTQKQGLELETLDKKYKSRIGAFENIMKRHEKNKKSAAYIHARQDWIRCRGEYAEARHEFYNRVETAYIKSLGRDQERMLAEAEKQVCHTLERIRKTRADAGALSVDEIAELISRDMNLLLGAMDRESRKKAYLLITEKAGEAAQMFRVPKTPMKRAPLPAVSALGIMNDKMSSEIIGKEFDEQADGVHRLSVSVNQAPVHVKEVIVSALLTLDSDDVRYSGRVMLTEFDNAVYCAVSTYYHYFRNQYAGTDAIPPMCITPQEIWRLVNGVPDSRANPSRAQIKCIRDSMDKMRRIIVEIDLKDEIRNHYILPDRDYITEGGADAHLINADFSYFKTSNGRMAEGYRINQKPILYAYNQAKNHLLFVPLELLDTSASTGNSGNTVEFRSYLLHQVQLMNNNYRKNNKILYSTIYKKTGVPSPEERIRRDHYVSDEAFKRGIRQEAKKDRDKITSILDAWKEKKFIKDYSNSVIQNRIDGVIIEPLPESKRIYAMNLPG